jgi:hypothetical protein
MKVYAAIPLHALPDRLEDQVQVLRGGLLQVDRMDLLSGEVIPQRIIA